MMNDVNKSDEKYQESIKFLERDFNQCFAQMRIYDVQIWDISKFSFGVYTAVFGVSISLYQYSAEKNINLVPVAGAIILVGFLIGFFLLYLTIRNRIYFVFVARYINEHRGFFLEKSPLGFENHSQMYTNPVQPPFFDWMSSQLWLSLIISILNSALLCLLVYAGIQNNEIKWLVIFFVFIITLTIQVISTICYLCSQEGKSASNAVFGND